MKTTLVTGGSGLLGNNVVRQLVARGERVRGLVRSNYDRRVFEGLDVEIAWGDVCDVESVRAACVGATQVIHAAGFVYIGWSQRERFQAVNVEGTQHVAAAAREVAARMVHVSSCDALGVRSLVEPADEDTAFQARAPVPYALTKHEAERVVLEEVGRGLDAVIVNPAFMLGPWDWKPSSGRMLLAVAAGRGWFAPPGHFSVCDVRDVAAGLITAAERGIAGRRYILAGETMSYFECWRRIADITGGRRPLAEPGPIPMAVAGWCGDVWAKLTGHETDINSAALALAKLPKHYTSERARRELGYQTRPVEHSIADAWQWFRDHGYVRAEPPSALSVLG